MTAPAAVAEACGLCGDEHGPSPAPAFYNVLNLVRNAGESPADAGTLMRVAAETAKDAFAEGTEAAEALALFAAQDPAVVLDFADRLSMAVLYAETGDEAQAVEWRKRAFKAATQTFPRGTRERIALGYLLVAARQVREAVA